MTVETCIKLLNLYKKNGNKAAYEDMKAHILGSNKFRDNPIITELLEKSKEEKKNGKKSKG